MTNVYTAADLSKLYKTSYCFCVTCTQQKLNFLQIKKKLPWNFKKIKKVLLYQVELTLKERYF